MKTNILSEALSFIKEHKATFHHSATRRGYRPTCVNSSPNKNSEWVKAYEVEEYNGKFGKGYILSMPNADGFDTYGEKHYSNQYYQIQYFIF